MKAGDGCVDDAALRRDLAVKAFEHTAAYDGAIANYFGARLAGEPEHFRRTLNLQLHKVQDLRYGENPHQRAAFYAEAPRLRRPGHRAAAAGQGPVLQQHRRYRRGPGLRQAVRGAGLRHRQARQPLRRGAGRHAAGLRARLRHRPGVRLRRHHRVQP
jgi:hypothetical protein